MAHGSFSCALQPISGKLFQYFSLKWTYLVYVFIFEFGSLLCATSVSSVMLIVGRAVAGAGSAGLFSGGLVILANCVALRQRPCELMSASFSSICLTISQYILLWWSPCCKASLSLSIGSFHVLCRLFHYFIAWCPPVVCMKRVLTYLQRRRKYSRTYLGRCLHPTCYMEVV